MDQTKRTPFELPRERNWQAVPRLSGILSAVGVIGLAVAIGHVFRGQLASSSIPLLLLLAVLVVSARFGFWTGIFASILAFLADNFFFIEPYFTFHVSNISDWLTLTVLLVSGATTGFLVGRLREEAEIASSRAHTLEVMGQCATILSASTSEQEVFTTLVQGLSSLEGGEAIVLKAKDDELLPMASIPIEMVLDAQDQTLAERAYRRGSPERPAAAGWAGGRFAFRSLGEGFGVVGFTQVAAARPEISHACEVMLDQAKLALQKLDHAEEARKAEASAQREALRSALLSSLSHDLRTPLATILGGVSTLRELGDRMSPEARQDVLLAVEEETGRLDRYVSNLLQMTRLKAGLALRPEWIDVMDIGQAAVDRARRAYPDREILLQAGENLPLIHSDAILLEQALFNILDNGLKFSPPETAVMVGLDYRDDSVVLAVKDRGPGLSGEEASSLFESFFYSPRLQHGGTGLGLAISRGIVEALGGKITLESPWAGRTGAMFEIVVPTGKRQP